MAEIHRTVLEKDECKVISCLIFKMEIEEVGKAKLLIFLDKIEAQQPYFTTVMKVFSSASRKQCSRSTCKKQPFFVTISEPGWRPP